MIQLIQYQENPLDNQGESSGHALTEFIGLFPRNDVSHELCDPLANYCKVPTLANIGRGDSGRRGQIETEAGEAEGPHRALVSASSSGLMRRAAVKRIN